jgi:hypothetical protein
LVPSRLIVPRFQHTRLLGEQEDLDEEVFQFGQEGTPKRGQRIVVRMQVTRVEAERHRLICGAFNRGAFNFARAEHPGSIAVEQQTQQYFGGIWFPSVRPILGIQRREVELSHAAYDEARQMISGKQSPRRTVR